MISFTHSKQLNAYDSDLCRLGCDAIKLTHTPSEKVLAPIVRSQSHDLLGSNYPPVVLIGTSYSRKPFEGLALDPMMGSGLEVTNLALDGGNVWGSIKKFINGNEYRGQPPKAIVWELPRRYILDSTPGAMADFLSKLEKFLSGP